MTNGFPDIASYSGPGIQQHQQPCSPPGRASHYQPIRTSCSAIPGDAPRSLTSSSDSIPRKSGPLIGMVSAEGLIRCLVNVPTCLTRNVLPIRTLSLTVLQDFTGCNSRVPHAQEILGHHSVSIDHLRHLLLRLRGDRLSSGTRNGQQVLRPRLETIFSTEIVSRRPGHGIE